MCFRGKKNVKVFTTLKSGGNRKILQEEGNGGCLQMRCGPSRGGRRKGDEQSEGITVLGELLGSYSWTER